MACLTARLLRFALIDLDFDERFRVPRCAPRMSSTALPAVLLISFPLKLLHPTLYS
jgi:hypothetical protein